MIAEAAGFALLAAVSPTALVVMAVFLGSDSPRQTAMVYTAGAIVMTVTAAVGGLFILRAVGLNLPRFHCGGRIARGQRFTSLRSSAHSVW